MSQATSANASQKKNSVYPEDAIVQTGDFVGYMLDKAVEKGVKEIIVLGSLRQTRQVSSEHL